MTSAVQSSTTEQSPTTEPSDKAVSEQSPTTEPSDKAVSEQVSASELMPIYFNPNLKSCSNCGFGGIFKKVSLRCCCILFETMSKGALEKWTPCTVSSRSGRQSKWKGPQGYQYGYSWKTPTQNHGSGLKVPTRTFERNAPPRC